MSYHNEMMNIQSAVEDYDYMGCQVYSYNEGHLDARHAAAEIALKADKEIAELFKCVRRLRRVIAFTRMDTEDRESANEAMIASYELSKRIDQ